MKREKATIFILSCMVFIGALLLFGMEPLVGRLLTPYFGSAAHVWLSCLMFFQAMLFLGYLYAHYIAQKLGGWHIVFLFLPLVNLPLGVIPCNDYNSPLVKLIAVLLLYTSIPFIALATTAVVAQSWLLLSPAGRTREPYPLYAVSNAGSLIALVGYTFLVEPLMGLRMQSLIWTGIYLIYVIIVIVAWLIVRPVKKISFVQNVQNVLDHRESIGWQIYVKWLMLSILPSAFLLAVTNFITMEVGSFPFIWVAPLVLYLVSFMLTFRKRGGVPKYLNIIWIEIIICAFILYLLGPRYWMNLFGILAIFFIICLVANGTLYEIRPPAQYLTKFYLIIALGGWIGGAFVSLIAPFIFRGFYEYPVVLAMIGIVFLFLHPSGLKIFFSGTPVPVFCIRVAIVLFLVSVLGIGINVSLSADVKYRHRNFYGFYYIVDMHNDDEIKGGIRKLIHGNTVHGAQLLDPIHRFTPLYYYYSGGGISDVIESIPSPRRIGIIGLGAGVVASLIRNEDYIDYYEIDQDNEWIARRWFTYLNESKGKVSVIVGDGRLSMSGEENKYKRYDLVFIDAFTGDAIPTHLLTIEALEIYLNKLKDNGLILFHISNRFYELRPVLKAVAGKFNLYGAFNIWAPQDKLQSYKLAPICVVITRNIANLKPLLDRGWKVFGKSDGMTECSPWSDDYINMILPLTENIKAKLK